MAEGKTELEPVIVGGRYRLLELAGSGAMATVHRARDEVLGRDVAVKTFRTHAPDPRHEERRRSEMQVLARLNHPSLVRLYDAGTDTQEDGTAHVAYLVMEFVHGTDLRQHLAAGRLTSDAVRRLGVDLASALAYVHSLGIVHRDIKPANILVPAASGSERPAKLTDFGIARLTDASKLTVTNTTIGTANYLSPEQARGEKVGPASDIYSLGLVLLEALKGAMEFTGGAVEAAVARLLRSPHIPAHLGESWVALLTRMTSSNVADRPEASEVLGVLRGDLPAAGTTASATEVVTEAMAPATPALGTRVLGLADEPHRGHSRARSGARPGATSRPRRGRLVWGATVVGVLSALLVVVPLILRAAIPAPSQEVPPATVSSVAPSQLASPPADVLPAQAAEPTPAASSVPAPEPPKANGKAKKAQSAPQSADD
ncbi:serine/threonine-protein kinase [Sinomonas notoginsengisoli]|uniref:serine/threonine-protein kinase n=1 Tax=Sinomonas notoginsengisoli TaxID=1457311 RepID=UPI001F397F50|nr:serine/threonine-protein kinase [Sinomonas notoginsengisoli]